MRLDWVKFNMAGTKAKKTDWDQKAKTKKTIKFIFYQLEFNYLISF